jgi:hypothetical protein
LAKIWKLTIDFIVKNMMKLANMELCRGLFFQQKIANQISLACLLNSEGTQHASA